MKNFIVVFSAIWLIASNIHAQQFQMGISGSANAYITNQLASNTSFSKVSLLPGYSYGVNASIIFSDMIQLRTGLIVNSSQTQIDMSVPIIKEEIPAIKLQLTYTQLPVHIMFLNRHEKKLNLSPLIGFSAYRYEKWESKSNLDEITNSEGQKVPTDLQVANGDMFSLDGGATLTTQLNERFNLQTSFIMSTGIGQGFSINTYRMDQKTERWTITNFDGFSLNTSLNYRFGKKVIQ